MKIHGNILKKGTIIEIIHENKLQKYGNILQKAGNKLKEKESDLKNLGEEMISVEIFR